MAKACGTAFAFVSPRGKLWRWQVGAFAKQNGCDDLDGIKAKFGKRWAHHQRHAIMAIVPQSVWWDRGPDGEPQSLWEVWECDRILRAGSVAEAIGCTYHEAYIGLNQPTIARTLTMDVRKWTGENLRRVAIEEDWERTVVWADGRVEKGSALGEVVGQTTRGPIET